MPEPVMTVFHPPVSLRWLAAATVVAVSAGLFVGGAQPVAVGLFRPPWDLLVHAGVFSVIGMMSGLASGTRGWRLLMFCLLGAVTVGAMDELHQLRLPGRSADWDDLVADAMGGLLGVFLLGVAYRWVDGGVWADRWQALLQKIQRVPNDAVDADLLLRLSQPVRPTVLAFVNAHAMNSAVHDATFYESLISADTLLRDGSGMSLLFKVLGMAPGQNLNGTDLIPRLVGQFRGRAIALLGTQEPYLTRAAGVVRNDLALDTHAAKANGFMPSDYYVALVRAHESELVVLGMGMPRQEEMACVLRAALTHPCLIVCGGAIIDFLGGRAPRAPVWMRRFGLEWVYRLMQEPGRLFRRYVLGNPLFLLRTLRLKMALLR
jgi:N-acetylglucosaminyldiphosphoundecaprenol N-acetyl-beta-D-mannosaminyltransferase